MTNLRKLRENLLLNEQFIEGNCAAERSALTAWLLEGKFDTYVELAKNKNAITVANKGKLVETIELVASAVGNGELDTAINKIAEEKKRSFAKSV